MDEEKIRLRIRHFLLQQSSFFKRAVAKDAKQLPPVSVMANELSGRIGMPSRRLQKYLTKELNPKEVSISITDLFLIAKLQELPLSQFLAYLLEEDVPKEMTGWKKSILDFFQNLHEGHRRSLSATLFSGKNHPKSERLLELLIQSYPLEDKDISILESIVSAFNARKNLQR